MKVMHDESLAEDGHDGEFSIPFGHINSYLVFII